jgi:hypothetical protein
MKKGLEAILEIALIGAAVSGSVVACKSDTVDDDMSGGSASGGKEAGCPSTGGKEAGCPSTGGKEAGCPSTGGTEAGCPSMGGMEAGCPSMGGMEAGCPSMGGAEAGCPSSGPGAFKADFESSKMFFTNMSEPKVGLDGSPHGVMRIHYSTNIQELIMKETFTAPTGTVAVKTQGYEAGEYKDILVMIKKAKGTLPDAGDWFFEVRDPEGKLVQGDQKELAFCAECHSHFPETDWLPGVGIEN